MGIDSKKLYLPKDFHMDKVKIVVNKMFTWSNDLQWLFIAAFGQ